MTLRPVTHRYERADSSSEPGTAGSSTLYAGGTDLIPLTRTGVIEAGPLVDIKQSGLSDAVERTGDGWRVGSLVTLSSLAGCDELVVQIPAIRHAVEQSATLQIRNRATVGGNLLQRPRCSYFRDPDIECFMKGGNDCPAVSGRNEHLALGGEHCVAPQPSDLASVLVAIDASVSIGPGFGESGSDKPLRTVNVADFLAAPTSDRRALHTLGEGEVIQFIDIPAPTGTMTSSYHKAMDRAAWQFALVGLAASVEFDGDGTVRRAALVASGVANAPLRLDAAEALLGRRLDATSVRDVAELAVDGLGHLSENGYKVRLLRGLVIRSLEALTR